MKQRTDESPMAETRDASDWTEDYSRLFMDTAHRSRKPNSMIDPGTFVRLTRDPTRAGILLEGDKSVAGSRMVRVLSRERNSAPLNRRVVVLPETCKERD